MKCPFCNYNDTKVIDSRAQDENSVIRRRRVCESCGKRFTTYERIDLIPITVIKSDERHHEVLQQTPCDSPADSGSGR